MSMPVITGLRITQEHASVSHIESVCQDDVSQRLRTLLESDGVAEAFVFQTCLRVELYVVTEDPEDGRKTLTELALGVPDDLVETMDHDASLRHLLRVTAGLESFVIGEDQILGQMQSAVETARAVDALGPTLETVLSKAISIGKHARNETAINDGPTSVADRPAVDVHDLEDVESFPRQAQADRRAAAATVEAMIDDVIAGMYRGAERRKQAELDEALSKLHNHGGLTDQQRAVVERLANALVSGLLATPTAALRRAAANGDWQTIEVAIDLFDPRMASQFLDDLGASIESMDPPASGRGMKTRNGSERP